MEATPFCSYCKKTFNSKNSFYQHVRRKHRESKSKRIVKKTSCSLSKNLSDDHGTEIEEKKEACNEEKKEACNEEKKKGCALCTYLGYTQLFFDYRIKTCRSVPDSVYTEPGFRDPWTPGVDPVADSSVIMHKSRGAVNSSYPQLMEDDYVLVIMTGVQSKVLQKFASGCVWIDEMKSANNYGFRLTTLLVTGDDFQCIFPCAFFISNRNDRASLEVFFTCIRERTGKVSTEVIITGVADYVYDAWISVMNAPGRRIYSEWDLRDAWRADLKTAMSSRKGEKVYALLFDLLREHDRAKFEVMSRNLQESLSGDAETAEFAAYFAGRYLKHVERWACFNPGSLQRMHKRLRQLYLHSTNTDMMNNSVTALLRLVRETALYSSTCKVHVEDGRTKLEDLKFRHRMSENTFLVENVEGAFDLGDRWLVMPPGGQRPFRVRRVVKECDCRLVCEECDACTHMYKCSCPDSKLQRNMCKHIHAVCMSIRHPDKRISVETDVTALLEVIIKSGESDVSSTGAAKRIESKAKDRLDDGVLLANREPVTELAVGDEKYRPTGLTNGSTASEKAEQALKKASEETVDNGGAGIEGGPVVFDWVVDETEISHPNTASDKGNANVENGMDTSVQPLDCVMGLLVVQEEVVVSTEAMELDPPPTEETDMTSESRPTASEDPSPPAFIPAMEAIAEADDEVSGETVQTVPGLFSTDDSPEAKAPDEPAASSIKTSELERLKRSYVEMFCLRVESLSSSEMPLLEKKLCELDEKLRARKESPDDFPEMRVLPPTRTYRCKRKSR